MSRCKMNECNLNTILLNIHHRNTKNKNILNHGINITGILHNNNTLQKVRVDISEVEDNKKEEDLVEEEDKLYVKIVGI